MILKFVDREEELAFLEKQYGSETPSFVVIYGRRRVGKTGLINRFAGSKPFFYYLCKRQNMALELERFREKFSDAFDVHLRSPKNFEELFSEIVEKIDPKRKFVLAIDEFTYWIEQDKGMPSTLQAVWDELLSKKNVMLILSGSIVSLMETEVLGYKSPLYGRRTGQWKVAPLGFFTLREFFPKYSIEEMVKAYSCTNCIPLYLLQFDPDKPCEENINATFFRKGNVLYEEGEFLLMEELRQTETYLNIILAVSQGSTKLSEIASKSKIDVTNIPKYLNVLMRLGIVSRIRPITMEKEGAIFRVSDKFFRFWTAFVHPYKAEIERGIIDFARFKTEFNTYLGSVFEDVCEEYLVGQNKRSKMPFSFTKIGKEWGKIPMKKKGENTYEIDIVALNEQTKQVLFCECKWQEHVDGKRILAELKEKARHVQWNGDKRTEYYAVFAKSFKERIDEPNAMLFGLEDLERAFHAR